MSARRHILLPLLCLTAIALAACSDKTNHIQHYEITAIFNSDGLGDHATTDNIFAGLCQVKDNMPDNTSVRLNLINLAPHQDLDSCINAWNATISDHPRLLIITNAAHAARFLQHDNHHLQPNNDILLLETPSPSSHCYSRYIQLYGLCHLAGQIIHQQHLSNPAIIRANASDQPLIEATKAFIDGYTLAGGTIDTSLIYSISNTAGLGYNTPDTLYNIIVAFSKLNTIYSPPVQFILPLCGSSSQGLYRFLRSIVSEIYGIKDYPIHTCGLDADQHIFSTNIAFSLIRHYDQLVYSFVTNWINGVSQPHHLSFGLGSDYATVNITQDYRSAVSDTSIRDYPNLVQIAIEKEQIYTSQNL